MGSGGGSGGGVVVGVVGWVCCGAVSVWVSVVDTWGRRRPSLVARSSISLKMSDSSLSLYNSYGVPPKDWAVRFRL